jgi:hypothetical protein
VLKNVARKVLKKAVGIATGKAVIVKRAARGAAAAV